MPATIYRIVEGDKTVYIGQTINPATRFNPSHPRYKPGRVFEELLLVSEHDKYTAEASLIASALEDGQPLENGSPIPLKGRMRFNRELFVKVTDKLADDLTTYARSVGMTESEVIRQALRAYLKDFLEVT